MLTEGKLLERAIRRLGEEEPNEDDLEEEEDAVADVVFPACTAHHQYKTVVQEARKRRTSVVDPNGVDKLVEESGSEQTAFGHSKSFCTHMEWKQLDQKRVEENTVPDVICRAEQEYEHHDSP